MKIKQAQKASNMKWGDVPVGGVVCLEHFNGVWMRLDIHSGVDLTDGATHKIGDTSPVSFYYPNATVELGNAE